MLKATKLVIVFALISLTLVQSALCWSNGGYSDDPANPDYGTHDWIAQHALDYLPEQEKQYITDNLVSYLLGTELPDNSNDTIGGIGDTTKHHIYYSSTGVLTDAASALRANETFNQAITYLRSGNYFGAAKSAGTLTHYIADLAVFGHVMGASTDWGAEVHHSDYENYVDTRTNNYTDTFNVYLAYDGILSTTTAYTATINLAYDTTFGGSNHLNCTWMDTNYNWSSSVFSDRCGESLNLAVNAVADVLHSLYVQVYPPPTTSPTPTSTPTPIPSVTPTPTPSPTTTPTQASTPTPTPPPTATPVPTANPTPKPTTPTPQPTATPKPTSTATPSPTPTAPEFPAVSLLIAALITLTAAAVLCKKKPKKQTTI